MHLSCVALGHIPASKKSRRWQDGGIRKGVTDAGCGLLRFLALWFLLGMKPVRHCQILEVVIIDLA